MIDSIEVEIFPSAWFTDVIRKMDVVNKSKRFQKNKGYRVCT